MFDLAEIFHYFTPDALPDAILPFIWACDPLRLGLFLLPVINWGSFTCRSERVIGLMVKKIDRKKRAMQSLN